jgi:hypothetical protein
MEGCAASERIMSRTESRLDDHIHGMLCEFFNAQEMPEGSRRDHAVQQLLHKLHESITTYSHGCTTSTAPIKCMRKLQNKIATLVHKPVWRAAELTKQEE